jgi:hypothetical protein
MPINQTIFITGSVGSGGANQSTDVMAIQQQLNGLMNPPRVQLAIDGRCGPKTCGMIADFQRCVLGVQRPDGRVDVNGRTLGALNDPQSEGKWARMSMGPPSVGGPPPIGGNLTPLEQQQLDALRAQAASRPDAAPAQDFLAYIAENEVATLKMLLNVQGAGQVPIEFLLGLANLRRAGFTAKELVQMFYFASQHGLARMRGVANCMLFVGKGPQIAGVLKSIGDIATVLQILATTVVVVDHLRAGRYGPAFAEIYATGMGMAVPWAGFLNAMQELLYAFNPNAKNDSKFQAMMRFMLAIDPIGAGKVAIDTGATFIQMAAKALFSNNVQGNDLDDLVARMRNSPMRFWVEIGDSTGNWMGDKFGDWYYENFLK